MTLPNGYGNATLHWLTVSVCGPCGARACRKGHKAGSGAGGAASAAAVDTWSRRVGLRSVSLVEAPLSRREGGPLKGASMFFRVNGVPVFAKGANWIAADQFEPRIPPRSRPGAGAALHASAGAGFERLLGGAKRAHFNMLRVWGGGVYERDDFYDVADEMGLMLWEEGKFACSLYPRNTAFLASVAVEVRDQVRRLSHHPSVVAYSGNNENQDMGRGGTLDEAVDYAVLYDGTVQRTTRALDPSRPYWPASPSNGATVDQPARGLYRLRGGGAGGAFFGDAHVYPQFGARPHVEPNRYDPNRLGAVDCEDLRAARYPPTRFLSEYGFISFPSFAAMDQVTQRSEQTANSTQMFFRMRQTWPRGADILLGQLMLHFHLPNASGNATERFRDLTYLSQAVHAHCVAIASTHHRLQRGGDANTMGLLFWSLNDQWQGQSDAAIDYTGRYKLLAHAARRFFAPLALVLHAPVACCAGNQTRGEWAATTILTAGVANDTPRHYSEGGTLVIRLRAWSDGRVLRTWTHRGVVVPAYSSANLTSAPIARLLGRFSAADVFLTAALLLPPWSGGASDGVSDPGQASPPWRQAATASTHYFFTKMKDAALRDPKVELTFGADLTLQVSVQAPAPFAFADPGRLRGHFDQNGLLLLPPAATATATDDDVEGSSPRDRRGTPPPAVVLTFQPASGEAGAVTLREFKDEVTFRTPWGTYASAPPQSAAA